MDLIIVLRFQENLLCGFAESLFDGAFQRVVGDANVAGHGGFDAASDVGVHFFVLGLSV